MRKIILLCALVLCNLSFCSPMNAFEATFENLFRSVKEMHKGEDVDYYKIEDYIGGDAVFVDAEPMKGWEHKCYIYHWISGSLGAGEPVMYEVRRWDVTMPPQNFTLIPWEVGNRYGGEAIYHPNVFAVAPDSVPEAVKRTYAIIISGGGNMYCNFERNWNDCSFIYQTLTRRYGVPKDQIYPLMADGKNPELDMRTYVRGYVSQPLDLDLDRLDDIELAATKTNLNNVFATLKNRMGQDDQLLLFVVDHGGRTGSGETAHSFIYLWNMETLMDTELAEMLAPFVEKNVNVNVVMGQNYAGGFIDDLSEVGCVVSAACKADEVSWASSDIPYSEFLYHWTCAMNGADGKGIDIDSDANSNGYLTVKEAFDYAAAHDRRGETPQYSSNPWFLGEDMAFTYLPPTDGLMIKDSYDDFGQEPHNITVSWDSPSIWCRNELDGIKEHENIIFDEDEDLNMRYVYVTVHNRGKKSYIGEKSLNVYWTLTSPISSPLAWGGQEYIDGYIPCGQRLDPVGIGTSRKPVLPGDSLTKVLYWRMPDQLGDLDESAEFSFFAKLLAPSEQEGVNEQQVSFDERQFRTHAQKNVKVVNAYDLGTDIPLYVRNISSEAKIYSLKLIPRTEADKAFFTEAVTKIKLEKSILQGWNNGGNRLKGASYLSAADKTITITSEDNSIENIVLSANSFDKINLNFSFLPVNTRSLSGASSYTLDLVQCDENGEILGGRAYIIKTPSPSAQSLDIICESVQHDGITVLTADNNDLRSVMWLNSKDEIIGEGNSIEVTPARGNDYFVAVGYNSDGEQMTGEISLEQNYGIESLSPATNVGDILNVTLCNEATSGTSLEISSVTDAQNPLRLAVTVGDKNCNLNVSTLKSGIYVVTLMVNDEIVDSMKFTKR